MIKKTSFHALNNNELNTLISRIITAINAVKSINTGVVAIILAKIIVLNNQLTKSLNTSFKTEHAKILKMLDDIRDNAFKAIRDCILGCSRRLNETFRLHGLKLLALFKTHGWSLWNENYQEESSKLNSLIMKLEGKEAQDSLAAVSLTEWFQELKKAQTDFEDAFQNKASDDIKKDFITIKEIRPEIISKTYELLDRINIDAKYLETSEEVTGLIKKLNNIIDETSMLAKSRKTRNELEEEEDLTLPEQVI